jgi:hypothetical protein
MHLGAPALGELGIAGALQTPASAWNIPRQQPDGQVAASVFLGDPTGDVAGKQHGLGGAGAIMQSAARLSGTLYHASDKSRLRIANQQVKAMLQQARNALETMDTV